MVKKNKKKSGSRQESEQKSKDDTDSSTHANKFMSILKDMFANVVLTQIITWFKQTVHDIQESIYITTRKILESALAMILLIFGIAMIVFSLPFLLSHYLQLPSSLFFVMFGLILIIISVISFDNINRSKYKKF